MAEGRLTALSRQLADTGIDPGSLDELQLELDALQHPPGMVNRATTALRKQATTQWGHIIGELKESAEAVRLLGKGLARQKLSAEEREAVRAQMLDLVRLVPASIITVANSALPVPGTGMFTPWILARLGLMPSRWREAHLLDQLHREAARLRAEGHLKAAAAIIDLQHQLEEEADERAQAEHCAELLTHWDANHNGVWDDDERLAYQQALGDMQENHRRFAARRSWYLSLEARVFGPVCLSEFPREPLRSEMLVCYNGQSGWVALDDLLDS